MDLTELQSVRDRERQTDTLQQLRESFYADAGGFIRQLQAERARAAERADDPFDAPEVNHLTDKINTAEQTVEAIYERRVGKIVKAASFTAADQPMEADGMTREEQELFDQLVGDIRANREHVLDVLDGEEHDDTGPDGSGPDRSSRSGSPPPQDNRATDGTTERSTAGLSGSGQSSASSGSSGRSNNDATTNRGEEPTPTTDEAVTDDAGSLSAADLMGNPSGESSGDHSRSPESATPDAPAPSDGGESGSVTDSQEPTAGREALTGATEGASVETTGHEKRPVRNDGGTDTRRDESTGNTGTLRETETDPAGTATRGTSVGTSNGDRTRVRIVEDVETFVGFDDRDYDLAADDVVVLPATNAEVLVDHGLAERLS